MYAYLNPWHKPEASHYGPKMYETDVEPVKYLGYLIYQRVHGAVWDVVKDGKCITQRAGLNGAKQAVADLLAA
jgi:hypothetical protein